MFLNSIIKVYYITIYYYIILYFLGFIIQGVSLEMPYFWDGFMNSKMYFFFRSDFPLGTDGIQAVAWYFSNI